MDEARYKKELKFIEESYASGIISQEEYETAKKRVEERLADSPEGKKILSQNEEAKKPVSSEPQKIISSEPKPTLDDDTDESTPLSTYKEDKDTFKAKTSPKKPLITPKRIGFFVLILILVLAIISFQSYTPVSTDNDSSGLVVPVCETDLDCQEEGLFGRCVNASTATAACTFEEALPVNVTIITSSDCPTCDTSRMQNTLVQLYPRAQLITLDRSSTEGAQFISTLGIDVLPAYVFDSSVETSKRFLETKSILEKKNGHYVMKPSASGASYFFKRAERSNTLELFFDPSHEPSLLALDHLDAFRSQENPTVILHLLTTTPDQPFYTASCVNKYAPTRIVSYLSCVDSGEGDCLSGLPTSQITSCIQDEAAQLLVQEEVRADGLAINTLPVFVINNQYKKGGSLSVELLSDSYCSVNEC